MAADPVLGGFQFDCPAISAAARRLVKTIRQFCPIESGPTVETGTYFSFDRDIWAHGLLINEWAELSRLLNPDDPGRFVHSLPGATAHIVRCARDERETAALISMWTACCIPAFGKFTGAVYNIAERTWIPGSLPMLSPDELLAIEHAADVLDDCADGTIKAPLREYVVAVTAGDLWKALAEGKTPGTTVSKISLGPHSGPNIAQPTFPEPADQSKWDTLERALALCDAEGGDRAEAMRKLIARIALAKGVDRREIINLPLGDFVAAATAKRGAQPVGSFSAHALAAMGGGTLEGNWNNAPPLVEAIEPAEPAREPDTPKESKRRAPAKISGIPKGVAGLPEDLCEVAETLRSYAALTFTRHDAQSALLRLLNDPVTRRPPGLLVRWYDEAFRAGDKEWAGKLGRQED